MNDFPNPRFSQGITPAFMPIHHTSFYSEHIAQGGRFTAAMGTNNIGIGAPVYNFPRFQAGKVNIVVLAQAG